MNNEKKRGRPKLTDEQREISKRKKMKYLKEYQREKYKKNSDYREKEKQRNLNYYYKKKNIKTNNINVH